MGVPKKASGQNTPLRCIQNEPIEFNLSKLLPKKPEIFGYYQDDSTSDENWPELNELAENQFDFNQATQKNSPTSLIIDVKPKRKIFQNEEERKKFIQGFTEKKKTELCKNWELNGSCKYGNNCSFAHGKKELKSKTHLNSNYKQKPCKQFLLKGFCFYGNRCQYLHREIKYYPEHKEFLLKAQKKNPLSLKSLVNFSSETDALKKMEKEYEKIKDVEAFFFKENQKEGRRLPIFSMFTV